MVKAVPYYDPGPYYVDPTEGGSDCLCTVAGDGSAARPYRITYCEDHEAGPTLVNPGPIVAGFVIALSLFVVGALLLFVPRAL